MPGFRVSIAAALLVALLAGAASRAVPGATAQTAAVPASFEITFRTDTIQSDIGPVIGLGTLLDDARHICSIPAPIAGYWDSAAGEALLDDQGILSGSCSAAPQVPFETNIASATLAGSVDLASGQLQFTHTGSYSQQYHGGELRVWTYTLTDTDGIVFNQVGSGTADLTMMVSCTVPLPLECGSLANRQYSGTIMYSVALEPFTCAAAAALARNGQQCQLVDVAIDSIMIVQRVQDEAGGVSLVRGKETYVRVVVRASTPVTGVRGVLARTGTLTLARVIDDQDVVATPVPSLSNALHSIDFEVPDDWLIDGNGVPITDWQLNAILQLPPNVFDPNPSNNARPVNVQLFESSNLTVHHISLCVILVHNEPCKRPKFPTLAPLGQHVLRYFPLEPEKYHETYNRALVFEGPIDTPEAISRLAAAIREERARLLQAAVASDHQIVAWIHHEVPSRAGGYSDNLTWGGEGRIALVKQSPALLANEDNFVKYLAHNLGIGRPDNNAQGDACNYAPGTTTSGWPYPNAFIHGWGPPLEIGGLQALPESSVDISAPMTCPAHRWISPHTFMRLRDRLQPAVPDTLTARSARTAVAAILVSGKASADGAQGNLTAASPLQLPDSALDATDAFSNHCLRFFQANVELVRRCFHLSFTDPETGEALTEESFAITVQSVPTADTIALYRGDTLLDQLTVTANAPVVSFTAPAAGQAWDGTGQISWEATDSDGDTMTFALFYRTSSQADWQPVGSGLTQSSFVLNALMFPPSPTGQFRVEASDGMRTGEAISETVTILSGSGDVDCSGNVDATDALDILQVIAGFDSPPCGVVADVNCDGPVDVGDALALRRHLVALPVELPQSCPPVGER